MFLSLMSLSAQVKLDSLLVFYAMNGNAGDSSGNGAHALAFNMVDTTNRFGDVEMAYYFNGSSGYLLLPNDSSLKPSFPFSVSMWVHIDNYPTVHQKLYSSDDVNNYSGFWITLDPQGKIAAGYGNNLGISTSNRRTRHVNNALSKDQWVHIVASFNGLNATEIFVDGVIQSGYYSGFASSVGYSNSVGSIGRYITNSGIRYVEAMLDDVRIYNDTLDQNDVNFLKYNVPCTGMMYDSIYVYDTVAHNITIYDTTSIYDTVKVSVQITQYDTIAIANTLLINSSISISENLESIFKVYPIPTQNYIYVDFGDENLNIKEKKIVVFNVAGQKVIEVPIEQKKTKIETKSLLGKGTYFIHLVNGQSQDLITKKIIVN